MSKIPEPEVTIQEKVYNLYTELTQAERDKKDTVKAHSDNIKRIKDELKEVLEEEESTLAAKQKEMTA
jgi:hypothetical protein